jgi:hypothetical protein
MPLPRPPQPAPWQHFLSWSLGFLLLCAPLLFSKGKTNLSADEATYYLPAISQIRNHWPALDLTADSLSATAPGYPYVLAGISRLTGEHVLTLRMLNWLVSLLVLWALWRLLYQTGGQVMCLLLLPLVFDNFFVKSSGYVVTDNAALLGIVGSLICIFHRVDTCTNLRGSLAATLAVCVRQNNIWLAAPLGINLLTQAYQERKWGVLLMGLVPFIPLGIMYWVWGGLVPPIWRETHEVRNFINTMPIVYLGTIMSVIGMPFYLSFTNWPQWRRDVRSAWPWLAGFGGLVLAGCTNSLPDKASGHWGGYWWTIADRFPSIGHASLLFLLLAPVGAWLAGAMVQRLWHKAETRPSVLYILALLAWVLTLTSNRQVFQRYCEPTLIIFLIMWTVLITKQNNRYQPARMWPIWALSGVQLALTLVTAVAQSQGWINFG